MTENLVYAVLQINTLKTFCWFSDKHRAYSVLQLNTHFFSSLFFYTYMSGFSGAELHVEDTHEDEVKPGVGWFRTAVKQAGIFSTLLTKNHMLV